MPYLAWIFFYFCPLRSAQKITGLKAWVTWSVTTWTTDSPSSQLAAKFACSSRWSAEPDGEKPPSDTAALLRPTFFTRCGNAKRHYRHSITPPDCTCLYLRKESKANKKKEEKKISAKSPIHCCSIAACRRFPQRSNCDPRPHQAHPSTRRSTAATSQRLNCEWGRSLSLLSGRGGNQMQSCCFLFLNK